MHRRHMPCVKKSFLCFLPLVLLLSFFFSDRIAAAEAIKFLENGETIAAHQDVGWYTPSQTRERIDLCGKWQYRAVGENQWREVTIPSSYDYQGEIIFKRNFSVDSSFYGRHFRLVAYGINYRCLIKINGKFVGSHKGGYSSFAIDVEDKLINIGQPNEIVIEVDSRLNRRDTIPLKPLMGGWKNYGGVFRELFLIALPNIIFEKPRILYNFDGAYKHCYLQIFLTLRKFESEVQQRSHNREGYFPFRIYYYVVVKEKDSGRIVVQSQRKTFEFRGSNVGELSLSVLLPDPHLWNLDDPRLYKLEAFLWRENELIDHFWSYFGLRELKISNGDILLNGERIVLRGVSRHEDFPNLGSALSYRAMESDIVAIKQLGANSLRLTHYPHHPYILDLCDRYGLLVFEEIPVCNVPTDALTRADFIQAAKDYLRETIYRDQNHPAVIAWGLGSGFDSSNMKSRKYVKEVADYARSLDNRPIYYATRMLKKDVSADLVDIIGLDIYPKGESNVLSSWERMYPDKPIVISSYAAPLHYGKGAAFQQLSIQQDQAFRLMKIYQEIEETQMLDGSFVTSFADWPAGVTLFSAYPSHDPSLTPVGLLSRDRQERISYKAMKSLFLANRSLQISSVDFPEENPPEYIIIGLVLTMIFVYLYRRDRRLRGNLKRVLTRPYGFYTELREGRKIPLFHSLFLGILISVEMALLLSSITFTFKRNLFFDYLLTPFIINDSWKQGISALIWNPMASIATFSSVFLILFALAAFFIRNLSFIVGQRVSFLSAFTFVFWVPANIVLLIPVAMLSNRLIQLKGLFPVLTFVVAAFLTWLGIRLFRGIKVLYHLTFAKTILLFSSLIVLSVGTLGSYYQNTVAIQQYLGYLWHLWKYGP